MKDIDTPNLTSLDVYEKTLGGYQSLKKAFAKQPDEIVEMASRFYQSLQYREAVRLEPDKGLNHFVLALVLEQVGEPGGAESAIASIGRAGEIGVKYACIINDMDRAFGRSGVGTVMGSKHLKAIAVRGTRGVEVDDADAHLVGGDNQSGAVRRDRQGRVAGPCGERDVGGPLAAVLDQRDRQQRAGRCSGVRRRGRRPGRIRSVRRHRGRGGEQAAGDRGGQPVMASKHRHDGSRERDHR